MIGTSIMKGSIAYGPELFDIFTFSMSVILVIMSHCCLLHIAIKTDIKKNYPVFIWKWKFGHRLVESFCEIISEYAYPCKIALDLSLWGENSLNNSRNGGKNKYNWSQPPAFNPLMPGGNKMVTHTKTNLQLKAGSQDVPLVYTYLDYNTLKKW